MNPEDEAYWNETVKWIKTSGDALVESGQRAEALRKLDDKRIQSIPTVYLIELQATHAAGSPQHLLAAHELQRRLTGLQVRSAYIACAIGSAVAFAILVLDRIFRWDR